MRCALRNAIHVHIFSIPSSTTVILSLCLPLYSGVTLPPSPIPLSESHVNFSLRQLLDWSRPAKVAFCVQFAWRRRFWNEGIAISSCVCVVSMYNQESLASLDSTIVDPADPETRSCAIPTSNTLVASELFLSVDCCRTDLIYST